VNPEPLADLITVTDAWNIDLKGWRNGFYERNCGKLDRFCET
jgi:pyruvate-formate lyase-activating enzyme